MITISTNPQPLYEHVYYQSYDKKCVFGTKTPENGNNEDISATDDEENKNIDEFFLPG